MPDRHAGPFLRFWDIKRQGSGRPKVPAGKKTAAGYRNRSCKPLTLTVPLLADGIVVSVKTVKGRDRHGTAGSLQRSAAFDHRLCGQRPGQPDERTDLSPFQRPADSVSGSGRGTVFHRGSDGRMGLSSIHHGNAKFRKIFISWKEAAGYGKKDSQ